MTSDVTSGLRRAAVIIPHFNDLARLERCLDALMPQAKAHDLEVMVADNNSAVSLDSLVARHGASGLRVVIETEQGAAPARNRGVAETTAPLLFFLDSDCVPAPDWIATALAQNLDGALVGGRVDVFDETPAPRSGAEAFETVFAFRQRDYVTRQKFSVTANLVTTRAVFDDVGGFRGGVSEDNDWCHRAIAKGYALRYCDALAVSHPTRSDWPSLVRKWRRTNAENFLRHSTEKHARLKWALRAVAVLGSGLVHLPQVMRHRDLSGSEKWAGAVTLIRLRTARAVWMLRQAVSGRA